uniref:Uncharacterized protein n=1 Tax=Timema bartmani TaxID=61472 RepID=A0A7R9I1G2_9NEOP|nr:unnamed protein product [Timema bartmani]
MALFYRTLLLVFSIVCDVVLAHVALTYPPARKYDLDFLDNSRTKGPCGMPKGSTLCATSGENGWTYESRRRTLQHCHLIRRCGRGRNHLIFTLAPRGLAIDHNVEVRQGDFNARVESETL